MERREVLQAMVALPATAAVVGGWAGRSEADRAAVRASLAALPKRDVALSAHDVSGTPGSPDTVGVVPPRGSVVVYFAAESEARTIDDLKRALVANDRRSLAELVQRVRALQPTVPPTPEEVVALFEKVDPVIEVRYGSKLVAQELGLLPGYRFGTVSLGYIGGTLRPSGFTVTEYHRVTGSPGYRYLVATRPPELTALERAALDKVPAVDNDVLVGPAYGDIVLGTPTDLAEQGKDDMTCVADVARDMVKRETTTWHRFDLLSQVEQDIVAGTVSPTQSAAALMKARHELVVRSVGK